MYITETKLLIDEIDTPILKTNGFFVNGKPLSESLFQEEYVTMRMDVIDEMIKLNKPNVSRGGDEQILGFSMAEIPQYRNMILESVTLRRLDNDGTANGLTEKLFMYINCYMDDKLVKTIYSDNSAKQESTDNLMTTWYFNDSYFRINQTINKMQFRFTSNKGVKENKTVRSSYMGTQNGKLYIEGWKTMYPNQSAGNEWRPFTTNFYLSLKKGISGIQDHIDNDVIHFTEENRQQLNQQYEDLNSALESHVDDGNIHVTAQEKQKINSITGDLGDLNSKLLNIINVHKNEEGLHWTVDDRVKFDKFNKHITNNNIHVTAKDKESWNNKVDYETFDNRFDELQKFFDTTIKEKIRNTKDIFFKDNTGSAARIHAWDMKTAEYVGEYLTQVTIYRPTTIEYIDSSDILHNNPQRLSVECLDVNNNLIDTYFSIDSDSQKDGDDNTTTWNFNEIKIKEEYNKLRFRVTTQGGVLENNPQSMKRAILCYTYTNIPDTNDWGLILQDNTIEAGHTMYFQFKTIIKQQNFAAHVVNADIHVTAEDKARWDNIVIPEIPEIPEPITYTAGNGIEITDNTISVITTDVIEESDKIPTSKALYNTFYGTRTFTNYDSSKYTQSADTVGTIVLSKKHFIKEGKITKIAIPHDKNIDNGEGGHLVIEVFAEDSSKTDGYDKANPIHRYYSDNYYAYKMNTQYGKYEWTFNNTECLIPSDYKVVHLSLVTNDTIVPSIGSSNNNRFRINCLAKNGNKNEGVVNEEDDECRVYWKANDNPNVGGDNFVAIVQVEFIGNKLDDFSIVPMLLERIAALEARVSELENS